MPKRSRKPRDLNAIAATIVAEATGDTSEPVIDEVQAAARALGRLGGKKGGPARAAKLDAKRRSEIAREAAKRRWDSQKHK